MNEEFIPPKYVGFWGSKLFKALILGWLAALFLIYIFADRELANNLGVLSLVIFLVFLAGLFEGASYGRYRDMVDQMEKDYHRNKKKVVAAPKDFDEKAIASRFYDNADVQSVYVDKGSNALRIEIVLFNEDEDTSLNLAILQNELQRENPDVFIVIHCSLEEEVDLESIEKDHALVTRM